MSRGPARSGCDDQKKKRPRDDETEDGGQVGASAPKLARIDEGGVATGVVAAVMKNIVDKSIKDGDAHAHVHAANGLGANGI